MPPRPKPDHAGQGVLWAGGRTRRKKRNGRLTNDETRLMASVERVAALHPGLIPFLIRVNCGQAFQGRRMPIREGKVITRDGKEIDLAGKWIMLEPRAIRLAPEGTPDFIGCRAGGQLIGAECKLEGQELEPEQVDTLTALHAAGALPLVVRNAEEFLADVKRACANEVRRETRRVGP